MKEPKPERSRSHEQLLRIVRGALYDAIKVHGPIDAPMVYSAAKRVAGMLRQYCSHESSLLDTPAPISPTPEMVAVFCAGLGGIKHAAKMMRVPVRDIEDWCSGAQDIPWHLAELMRRMARDP